MLDLDNAPVHFEPAPGRDRRGPIRWLVTLGALATISFAALACDDGGDGPDQTASPSSTLDIADLGVTDALEAYAKAAFEAWQAGDTAAIDELASEDAALALRGRAWTESDEWVFDDCTVSDESYCTWQGASETLLFELDTSTIADERQALVAVEFAAAEPGAAGVSVPTDPEQYADAVFLAWSEGNGTAIEQLVAPMARPVLDSRAWLPSDGWKKSGCESAAEGFFCRWEATNGETLELRLDEDLVNRGAGEAADHAIFSGF